MRSIGLLAFMIPFGISFANSVLMGRMVGAGNVTAVKHYYRVSMLLAVFVGIIQIAILLPTRDIVISIFT